MLKGATLVKCCGIKGNTQNVPFRTRAVSQLIGRFETVETVTLHGKLLLRQRFLLRIYCFMNPTSAAGCPGNTLEVLRNNEALREKIDIFHRRTLSVDSLFVRQLPGTDRRRHVLPA